MRSLLFPAAGAFVLLAALLLTPAPVPMATTVHPAPTAAEQLAAFDRQLGSLAARYGHPDRAPEWQRDEWLKMLAAREELATATTSTSR